MGAFLRPYTLIFYAGHVYPVAAATTGFQIMRLSEHFDLSEYTTSQTAARHGIDNTPNAEQLKHLYIAAAGMERVRTLLGKPILISSGFRSEELNAVVPGSSDTSAHTLGYATDFTSPGYGNVLRICQAIKASDIKFDQLIYEYGTWVHISFDPRMRGQILTKLSGQPYRTGLPK